MQINPYRVLVQLIPGSLFIGIILLNECGIEEVTLFGTAIITFLTLMSIVIGYVFNGIGHLLEMLLFKKYLESNIQINLNNPDDGGKLVRFFRKFSIISLDEVIINAEPGPRQIRSYDRESRAWSKEENKFARTLFLTCVFLFVYLFSVNYKCISVNIFFNIIISLFVLMIIAFYRYIVSHIDYCYKRRNSRA